MTADRLPDDIERDLTLAHAENCGCHVAMPGGVIGYIADGRCHDLRSTLRRAIAVALVDARVVQHGDDCARFHVSETTNASGDVCYVLLNLHARAKALREGR